MTGTASLLTGSADGMPYPTIALQQQVPPAVQLYFQLCDQWRASPLPAVTMAIAVPSTATIQLEPEDTHLRDLIPMAQVLVRNTTVETLLMNGCKLHNLGADIIGQLLAVNTSIQEVSACHCDIGERGAIAFAKGAMHSPAIRRIRLRGNRIGLAGAAALARVVRKAPQLELLDVSANALGTRGLQELAMARQTRSAARANAALRAQAAAVRAVAEETQITGGTGAARAATRVMSGAATRMLAAMRPDVYIRAGGNLVSFEVYNSLVHGAGLVCALIGCAQLVQAAHAAQDNLLVLSLLPYCAGLVGMFLAATLSHSLFFLEATAQFLNSADKVAVFVLIAGTYTPFMLINLGHLDWSWLWLLGIWAISMATAGITAFTGSAEHPEASVLLGFNRRQIRIIAYMILGWLAGVPLRLGRDCFPAHARGMLTIGGVVYSLGMFWYLRDRMWPSRSRGVWYLLVVMASTCHFYAVASGVMRVPGCGVSHVQPSTLLSAASPTFDYTSLHPPRNVTGLITADWGATVQPFDTSGTLLNDCMAALRHLTDSAAQLPGKWVPLGV